MRLSHPMQLVTPTVDGDVLVVLARTEQGFTPGEVQRLIGTHSIHGIRKALNRLTEQGIVQAERRGNATIYTFNHLHIAAQAISEIANVRQALINRLRDQLAGFTLAPTYAALFGSAARDDMRPDSDLDLFLVRPDDLDDAAVDAWERDVHELSQQATAWTGNDTRVLELSEGEVAGGLANQDDPVLDSIREDGIHLAGPRSFWRQSVANR